MSDNKWKDKLEEISNSLSDICREMKSDSQDAGETDALSEEPGDDEGDPGPDDNSIPEGDGHAFASGAHDKHIGTDASESEEHDPEDKKTRAALLLAALKKHG